MGFTLRIWFSGICHFVDNKNPNARCKLCVVLPVASDRLGSADHFGRITSVRHVVKNGRRRIEPDKDLLEHHLDRHRITFRLTQEEILEPRDPEPIPPPPGIVNFEQIAGIYADENLEIVDGNPPEEVLAQVLLESRDIRSHSEISVFKTWEMPRRLVGFPGSLQLADPVFVDFHDLVQAEMVVSEIGEDGSSRNGLSVPLRSDESGLAEILILNECERLICPLELRRKAVDELVLVQIDKDFVWHYDMLHYSALHSIDENEAVIRRLAMSREDEFLPVPENELISLRFAPHLIGFLDTLPLPISNDVDLKGVESLALGGHFSRAHQFLIDLLGGGVGSGCDCLGCSGRPRFFQLDDLLDVVPETAEEAPSASEKDALDESLSLASANATAQPLAQVEVALRAPVENRVSATRKRGKPRRV